MLYDRHGQQRVLMKRKRSKSAIPVLHSPVKRTKQKLRTNEQMEQAMNALRYCKAEAARMYNVPQTWN